VLIIQDEPVTVGIVLRVRPIGMFSMHWQDSAKQDDKIVAVSVNDPMYADCHSMDVLATHYFAEIDYFFRSYLDLRDPGISTDWGDAETARRAVREGHARYRAGTSDR
jgi:inorganic pyrophosphatase